MLDTESAWIRVVQGGGMTIIQMIGVTSIGNPF